MCSNYDNGICHKTNEPCFYVGEEAEESGVDVIDCPDYEEA